MARRVPEGTAWCSGCQAYWPTERFNRGNGRYNGLQALCKDCEYERNRRKDHDKTANYANRSRRRRVKLKGAEGGHTPYEFWLLSFLLTPDNVCPGCGTVQPMTEDHIVAVNRGGSDWVYNLQPLCGKCNSAKKDGEPIDYRPQLVKDHWDHIKQTIDRLLVEKGLRDE